MRMLARNKLKEALKRVENLQAACLKIPDWKCRETTDCKAKKRVRESKRQHG